MDLRRLYRERRPDERKGDFGRVLVAGGSQRYAGASAFNALAALRAGADLALVVAPRRAADLVGSYAPDLITIPCETPHPDPALVLEEAARADALVLGGGVERTHEAHAALLEIIRACHIPMVLDAEALHAIAPHPDVLKGKQALLTPHGGEFAVLTGRPWPRDEEARLLAARQAARARHATLLVKGARDVVSDGQREHVDASGSPYLTKGGYGDLLAGVAGALLARGHAPYDAGCAAAFLVGEAGERAASRMGESTLASDALAQIAHVLAHATGIEGPHAWADADQSPRRPSKEGPGPTG